jgi:hypothetical protein
MYAEGWITRMKRQVAEQQKLPRTLEEHIKAWWEGLPENQRASQYHMSFFTEKFNRPAQVIGPVLYTLGWRRIRSWKSGEPFCRVWMPPD